MCKWFVSFNIFGYWLGCAMTATVKSDSCLSDSYLDVQSKDNVVWRTKFAH